jgi:hypothetical protein
LRRKIGKAADSKKYQVVVRSLNATKGLAMKDIKKLGACAVFIGQSAIVVWLSQRIQPDIFSQLVLLPLILLAGLALLGLQQTGD